MQRESDQSTGAAAAAAAATPSSAEPISSLPAAPAAVLGSSSSVAPVPDATAASSNNRRESTSVADWSFMDQLPEASAEGSPKGADAELAASDGGVAPATETRGEAPELLVAAGSQEEDSDAVDAHCDQPESDGAGEDKGGSRTESCDPASLKRESEKGSVANAAPSDGPPPRKEVRLSAADASSIMSRTATFIPFNPWTQDVGHLSVVEQQLDEPVELSTMQKTLHKKLVRFQSDNNTTLKHYDAVGFNYDRNMRGSTSVTCLAHAEDSNIVYASGRHITVVGIESVHRQMLLRAENCIVINTFDVSSNGKYIAISERRTDAPYVTVYKIDSYAKVASLNFKFLCKTQITTVAFSSNNKYLATVSGAPDQKLFLWQLDDLKVLAMVEVPKASSTLFRDDRAAGACLAIEAVRVNPWQSLQLSTTGDTDLLLWRVQEKNLVPFDPVAASKRPLSFEWPPPQQLQQQRSLARMSSRHLGATATATAESGSPQAAVTVSRKWAAHAWYDEECLAAVTENGFLLAVEANAIKLFVNVLTDAMDRVTHIAWASRGVIIAGSNGTLLLMDRTYVDSVFTPVAQFQTAERHASIVAVSVSPAELNVVVALNNNTMEWMSLAEVDNALQELEDEEMSKLENALSEAEKMDIMERTAKISSLNAGVMSPEASRMLRSSMAAAASGGASLRSGSVTPIAGMQQQQQPPRFASAAMTIPKCLFNVMGHVSFHSATITSVSFALQRPIVMTTSDDCHIRVFDYTKHRTLLCKKLEDEVLSGSLHPMGLHLVLSFRFSVKVYALLEDDLHQMAELNIKSAHEVRYSPLGARIAFSVANRVVIHDGHSYAFLGMLVGHTSMVKSITWLPNGGLCTTDLVGMILRWDGSTFRRTGSDSSHKNLIFQHAIFDPETELLAAVGSNKHARGKIFEGEFTIVCASPTQEDAVVYVRPGMILPKGLATRKLHCHLLALAQLSKTLFVGTPTGRVLLFAWPLLATSKPYDFIDSHNCEIVHLHLSPGERFLLTVGSDHVMFVYELTQLKAGKFVALEQFDFTLFDGVRFMRASDMDDRDREIHATRRHVEDRRVECDAHLSLLARKKEEENVAAARNAEAEIESLRRKIDVITSETHALQQQAHEHTAVVESQHMRAAEQIESIYNKRSSDAARQFRALESEKGTLLARYEGLLAKKVAQWDQTRASMEMQRREREKQLSQQVEELRDQVRQKCRHADAMIAQTVIDMEMEVSALNSAHDEAVMLNEEKVVKASASASVGDREAERIRKEITLLKHRLSQRTQIHKDLTTATERRAREIKQLKADMLAKQESINVAEKSMQSFKHQLTVLENLRFVLTYQFDELQSEVVPKDTKIRQLEHQIREMEEDLQHINVERNATRERVEAVNAQLDVLTEEQRKLRVAQLDMERRFKTFHDELGLLQERYRDPLHFALDFEKTLREAKRIFKYKEPEVSEEAGKLAQELETHQRYLESCRANLGNFVGHKQQLLCDRSRELLGENSQLIAQIKGLRQERRALTHECTALEVQLRDVRMTLHRLSHNPRAIITAGPAPRALVRRPMQELPSQDPLALRTPSPSVMVPASALDASQDEPRTVAKPRAILPPIAAGNAGRGGSAMGNTTTATATTTTTATATATTTPPVAVRARSSSKGRFGTTKKVFAGQSRAASQDPSRSASSLKKPKRQSTPQHRQTQLQQAIAQLDANSLRIREQEGEIETLRFFAQDLLRAEEQRLMSELRGFTPTAASAAAPMGAGGDDRSGGASPHSDAPQGPTPTPTPAAAAGGGGGDGGARGAGGGHRRGGSGGGSGGGGGGDADDMSPDWNVESTAAVRAAAAMRPMSPGSRPAPAPTLAS